MNSKFETWLQKAMITGAINDYDYSIRDRRTSKGLEKVATCVRYLGNKEHLVLPPFDLIETGAFRNTNIKSIVIGECTKLIHNSAFEYCDKLERVEILGKVKYLYEQTFQGCEHLRYIKLPRTLKEIGPNCFAYCIKLEQIELPDGLRKIGSQAFHRCGLKHLTLNRDLLSIGKEFIYGCLQLEDITILSEYLYVPFPDQTFVIAHTMEYRLRTIKTIIETAWLKQTALEFGYNIELIKE